MAHLARALPLAAAAAVPPRFFAQCAGAYVALTLAAVVLTRTELRLPLVHYRASRAQVQKVLELLFICKAPCPPPWCSCARSCDCRSSTTARRAHR